MTQKDEITILVPSKTVNFMDMELLLSATVTYFKPDGSMAFGKAKESTLGKMASEPEFFNKN